MKIEPHSVWGYVGPGPGKDMRHRVVMVQEDIVTTWSEFDKNPSNGGFAWNGTSEQFLKEFKPYQFSK